MIFPPTRVHSSQAQSCGDAVCWPGVLLAHLGPKLLAHMLAWDPTVPTPPPQDPNTFTVPQAHHTSMLCPQPYPGSSSWGNPQAHFAFMGVNPQVPIQPPQHHHIPKAPCKLASPGAYEWDHTGNRSIQSAPNSLLLMCLGSWFFFFPFPAAFYQKEQNRMKQ